MIRQMICLAAAFVAVILSLGLTAGSATADVKVSADTIPGLEIVRVGYNAPGVDSMANRNAEFIEVVNTSNDPVDVGGLVVEDAWAHGDPSDSRCNTYTVETFAVVGADGTLSRTKELPAGHTLRVYVGAGVASANGKLHSLFMDSPDGCGNHGQFLNNTKHGTGDVAWDVVYVTLKGATEWKSYNFDAGYFVA